MDDNDNDKLQQEFAQRYLQIVQRKRQRAGQRQRIGDDEESKAQVPAPVPQQPLADGPVLPGGWKNHLQFHQDFQYRAINGLGPKWQHGVRMRYQPNDVQRDTMPFLCRQLDQLDDDNVHNRTVILEQSTGSGKTTQVLSAALTWLAQSPESAGCKGILWVSRTHEQLYQVVREYDRLVMAPAAVHLQSRDFLCNNDQLKNGGLKGTRLNAACQGQIKRAACEQHKSYTEWTQERSDSIKAAQVPDIEDLQLPENVCQYYGRRTLAERSKHVPLILMTYAQLFGGPGNERQADFVGGLIASRIVVMDEGHNTVSSAEQAFNMKTNAQQLRSLIPQRTGPFATMRVNEPVQLLAMVIDQLETKATQCLQSFYQTREQLQQRPPLSTAETLFDEQFVQCVADQLMPKLLLRTPGVDQQTMTYQQQIDVFKDTLDDQISNYESSQLKLANKIVQLVQVAQFEQPNKQANGDNGTEEFAVFLLELLAVTIYNRHLKQLVSQGFMSQIEQGRIVSEPVARTRAQQQKLMDPQLDCLYVTRPAPSRVAITMQCYGAANNNNNRFFEIECIDATAAWTSYTQYEPRCTILLSGTLKPGSYWETRLGKATQWPANQQYYCAKSVAPADQLAYVWMPRDQMGRPIEAKSSGPAANKQHAYDTICQLVCMLVRVVQRGVLVFFTSKEAALSAYAYWQSKGQQYTGDVVIECEGSVTPTTEIIQKMKQQPIPFHALFAVYRGQISEGLDTVGDICNAVVLSDIAYPNINSVSQRLKQQAWTTTEQEVDRVREMNITMLQACGRGVRGADDSCILVRVGPRFQVRESENDILIGRNITYPTPAWMPRGVLAGGVTSDLERHLKDKWTKATHRRQANQTTPAAQTQASAQAQTWPQPLADEPTRMEEEPIAPAQDRVTYEEWQQYHASELDNHFSRVVRSVSREWEWEYMRKYASEHGREFPQTSFREWTHREYQFNDESDESD